MGGIADAHRSEVEIGGWLGIDYDFSRCTIGLTANSDGAGVGACHCHSTAGTSGVLLAGSESTRPRPTVGGSCLPVGCQVNGFAYAIGTVVVYQRRQNAAVGSAGASV